MTSVILAASVACSSEPLHIRREWAVDGARRLHLLDTSSDGLPPAMRHALKEPIPGTAAPVVCDPFKQPIVLLDDWSTWRLDWRGAPRWYPQSTECYGMSKKDEGPRIVGGWNCCKGGFVVADKDRRLWRVTPTSRTLLAPDPVPLTGRIVLVNDIAKTATLEGGERFSALAGGWVQIPGPLEDATGMMMVLVVHGFSRGPELGDAAEGQRLTLPQAEALNEMRLGRVVPAPPEATA